ncbi:hypothetical protein TUM4644_05520 [Shewanella colwelliana]|uniref:hypothetical protein n=1 Tax=Shewanella colwelliana TaxID=23 RepID=UPI001BC51E7D|nr:hypothetical protein [Shewanella colwelliana]GIU18713.1 hypothetical protein TUM4644_05520 [Shewanella colwelliana]
MKLHHLIFAITTIALCAILITAFYSSQQSSPVVALEDSIQSKQQTTATLPTEPLTNNDEAEQSQELTTRGEQVQAQDEELEPISGEEISSLFIDDDNVINGGAVERLLREELDQFIVRITALEQDEMGANRMSLLGDTLSTLTDTRIYSQQFGCTGRICALTLVTDNLPQQVTDKIAKFDDNYTFIRRVESENGDIKFQAIYLQTHDPSTMSFRQ